MTILLIPLTTEPYFTGVQYISMLSLMRKHAKNWLMKVILGIIIVVFIFYFGSMRGRRQTETIAIVDNTRITYTEFRKEYQNLLDLYQQQYGSSLTDDMLKALNPKQQAYNTIIEQAIILAQADRLNLDVSNTELQDAIYSYPIFQRNGVFNKQLYEQRLRYQRLSPEEFEGIQKRILKVSKLERLIKESAKVSEVEIYDIYRTQYGKVNLDFIKIDEAPFREGIAPTTEDLETFLREQGEDFRAPRKVLLKYMVFRGDDYAGAADLSDDEIEEYYDYHQEEFTNDEGVTSPLEEVRTTIADALKAQIGLDRAHDDANLAHDIIYQEENFEEYAREENREIVTAEISEEGELPEELVNLGQLKEYALRAYAGEIIPVLSDDTGRYVIKVDGFKESYIPELSAIKERVLQKYTETEAARRCESHAETLLERLKNGEEMTTIARNENRTISETGFFVPSPQIPEIGFSPDLAEAIYELTAKEPYPDRVFPVDGGYVVVRLKESGALDDEDWQSKRDALTNYILKIKQETYFRSWLDEIRESMIDAGKIKILKVSEDL